MFGYIKPDGLVGGEKGLFQAFMCSVCLSSKAYSPEARAAVGNDITFFNALFHSAADVDVKIVNGKCFSHPIVDKPLMTPDDVSDRLAAANVLLTYLSLSDHVSDGDAKLTQKLARKIFAKDYAKAKEILPELERQLVDDCKSLYALEKSSCSVLDEVCEPSAMLSVHVCREVLKEKSNPFVENLCYNLGKWVYLIDAVDDFNKDLRKKAYNPFIAANGATLDEAALADVSFLLNVVSNRAVTCLNDANLTKYKCVLENVVFVSLRAQNTKYLTRLKEQNGIRN